VARFRQLVLTVASKMESEGMDRRCFMKALGAAGAGSLLPETVRAAPAATVREGCAILVDTTMCVGCRGCEEACSKAHNLPPPDILDETVFEKERRTSETQLSVVNRYRVGDKEAFRKQQCMHCNQPACTAACLTKAMFKTPEGPVIWRSEKCMGCRYCMLSCPFDVPKFEYNSAVPRILKCDMCIDRVREGKKPACVEVCPAEALQFGRRNELIEVARSRIYQEPDKYAHHIYGEDEVGGTGVMYLTPMPAEEMGLKADVGTTPYPEYTKPFLYSVPIVLTLWPAFLLACSNATKTEGNKDQSEE